MLPILKVLYESFIPGIKTSYILLRVSFRRLSLRQLLSDFTAVASSIGFVAIPAFLAGVLFVLLPQGRDTLLLVVEKMAGGNYIPLMFLLIALVIWSLFSELGVRYAINISDNSGMNLSDDRVDWRKFVQRLLSAFFLLWPPLLLIGGFLWCMIAADYITSQSGPFYFIFCIICLSLIILILSFLYFHKFGKAAPGRPKHTLFGRRSLPPEEQRWANKLYGIYNDYIFFIPKPTNYQLPYSKDIRKFTDHFTKNAELQRNFPQNEKVLRDLKLVPSVFRLVNANKVTRGRGDFYKWQYCIPPGFYKVLHRHITRMFLFSLLTLFIVAFIPAESAIFRSLGAPALICLAFASYTGIYCGLLYLDKALLRRWKISVRFLLAVLFLLTTVYNSDHPVRQVPQTQHRPDFTAHFQKWFSDYRSQIDAQYGADTSRKYPVVFICAEGGAFRTGAYTSLFLTKMEESALQRSIPVDFRKSVFAMSGVSGGAAGLGFYNAIAFRDQIPVTRSNTFHKTEQFFLYDSLSPLIGKMLFGEFLNLFILKHIERFDRAVALEKSWEEAYHEFIGQRRGNTYSRNFILPDTGAVKPMLVINTTEIESGLQCWMTNLDMKSLRFRHDRDLLLHKIGTTSYSTAINFSSRFPLFSPAAATTLGNRDTSYRLHYLDGGYVENTGSASMLEILEILQSSKDADKVVPVVISLLFSEEDKRRPNIHVFNDVNEVISGIYNTRAGSSRTSRNKLSVLVSKWNKGIMIDAPLSAEQKSVPMNWVLSGQSMNLIKKDVINKLNAEGDIMKKFFRPDLNYIRYAKK
jgi:hypothetical protein